MPHFTLSITSEGALLNAGVTVSAAREEALKNAGLPIPDLVPIRALIDTGASITCIDPSALSPLNLTPTGSTTTGELGSGLVSCTFQPFPSLSLDRLTLLLTVA